MKGIDVCNEGEKYLKEHLSHLKSNKRNQKKQKKKAQSLLRILLDDLGFNFKIERR